MLKRPYSRLPKVTFWRQSAEGNGVWTTPQAGLMEADTLAQIIDETHQEHLADLDSSGGNKFIEGDQSENQAFTRRVVRRFTTLVVFGGSLNGLLRRIHTELEASCDHWLAGYTASGIPQSHLDRFEPIRLWRNKVFAHTAYADPRRDNLTDRLTSLALLVGNGASILKNGDMRFGGFSVVAGGEAATNNFTNFTIGELADLLREHLDAWWDLLNDPASALTSLTLERAQSQDSDITRIDIAGDESERID